MAWVRCCGSAKKAAPVVLWDANDTPSYSAKWPNGTPNSSFNNYSVDYWQTVTKTCTLDQDYNGRTLVIDCDMTGYLRTDLGDIIKTEVRIGTTLLSTINTSLGTGHFEIPITSSGVSLSLKNMYYGNDQIRTNAAFSYTKIEIQ